MNLLRSTVRFLGSLQLGVILLVAMFALVFWGTLFEAKVGMELGTDRFFNSWTLNIAGILPFPAMKSLASLLALNILFACIFRVPHTLKKFGVLLIHIAVLILIVGSFAGANLRESFPAFGAVGGNVTLDSASEASFKILSAKETGAFVLESFGDTLEVAPNSPQKVGDYTVYFAESFELSPTLTAVEFFAKKDPLSFVPYLFLIVLFAGILWNLVAKMREKKS